MTPQDNNDDDDPRKGLPTEKVLRWQQPGDHNRDDEQNKDAPYPEQPRDQGNPKF